MSRSEVESSPRDCVPEPASPGAFRGAVGFGLGAAAFLLLSFVLPDILGIGQLLRLVIVGVIGGGVLAWEGKAQWRSALIAAAGFGLACIPAWQPLVILPFAFAAVHSPLDILLSGVFSALPLAMIGGLGAPLLATRPRLHSLTRLIALVGVGALAFGFSGALGGVVAVLLVPSLRLLGLGVGLVTSFALGGALLGALVGRLERRSPRSEAAVPGCAPTARVSGIAVAGVVLGLIACVAAMLPPHWLRLPEIPMLTGLMREMRDAQKTSVLLVCLGLPPLLLGLVAAEGIRRGQPRLRGMPWARFAIVCGVLVMLSSLRFLSPSVANESEQEHALDRLARVRGHESYWDYGNIVHEAHTALGRIALREGDIAEAKRQLLEAGRTPGSPQLNSYGPDMTLARDLLAKGEHEVVLDYFELCRRFWKDEAHLLDRWSQDVREGRRPDFGSHARH